MDAESSDDQKNDETLPEERRTHTHTHELTSAHALHVNSLLDARSALRRFLYKCVGSTPTHFRLPVVTLSNQGLNDDDVRDLSNEQT